MNNKKFVYYICCLDTKLEYDDVTYDEIFSGNDFSEKQLKKIGIRFLKEMPSYYDGLTFTNATKNKGVKIFQKLSDLIFDYIDFKLAELSIQEDTEQNDPDILTNIFSYFMKDCIVVKKYKELNQFKIVDPDVLFNCYKQVIQEHSHEFFENDENNDLPQNMEISNSDSCVNTFYQIINVAMTKFSFGTIIFNDTDVWDVHKENGEIWFGTKKEQDSLFKAKLLNRSFMSFFSCILRVQTLSKKNNEYYYEIYGFSAYRDENYNFVIENTEAERLKESYSFNHVTKNPIEHVETDIYCDLDGEKIMNL